MSLKFWFWLKQYCENKIRSLYMDEYYHDRLCQRCLSWSSLVGGVKDYAVDEQDDFIEYTTCLKCGHTTKWDTRNILPLYYEEYNK